MSEAVRLRRIVERTVRKHNSKKPGTILMESSEEFLCEVLGVTSKEFDPKSSGGIGLGTEEGDVSTLWQKYERDSEVPYASWADIELAKKEYDEEERERVEKD